MIEMKAPDQLIIESLVTLNGEYTKMEKDRFLREIIERIGKIVETTAKEYDFAIEMYGIDYAETEDEVNDKSIEQHFGKQIEFGDSNVDLSKVSIYQILSEIKNRLNNKFDEGELEYDSE